MRKTGAETRTVVSADINYHSVIQSQNGLDRKGPFQIIQSKPPATGRDFFPETGLLKGTSNLALNTFTDGASTTSGGGGSDQGLSRLLQVCGCASFHGERPLTSQCLTNSVSPMFYPGECFCKSRVEVGREVLGLVSHRQEITLLPAQGCGISASYRRNKMLF